MTVAAAKSPAARGTGGSGSPGHPALPTPEHPRGSTRHQKQRPLPIYSKYPMTFTKYVLQSATPIDNKGNWEKKPL